MSTMGIKLQNELTVNWLVCCRLHHCVVGTTTAAVDSVGASPSMEYLCGQVRN